MLATTALLSVGCADNEATNGNGQKEQESLQGTTFVGGITPNAGAKPSTRTSLNAILPGGTTVDYFWEKGDKIWTADNTNGEAQITTTSPTAKFQVGKDYTTPTVELYYPGKNATVYNEVTIATEQTQIAPNNTQHLGEAGDCGTATAHQQPDGTYHFNLDHQAAYLCLLPRTSNKLISTYITKIKITSDNNIAGTYTLTSAGLMGSGTSKNITLVTKGTGTTAGPYNTDGTPSTVPVPGFLLNNATTSQSTNAAYVVIAPGTHALTIEYTIKDAMTDGEGTITKTLPSQPYLANTLYPLTANINLPNFEAKYYLWDAGINQHLWAGHESEQPTLNFIYPATTNLPKNNTDPRWYNSTLFASRSHAEAPTFNEAAWYIDKGDIRFDETSLWTTMGHLYKRGFWMKKLKTIADENHTTVSALKAAAPNGINYNNQTTNTPPYSNISTHQLPGKPDNTNDYVYLPGLGSTDSYFGMVAGLGYGNASFWLNVAYDSSSAYYFRLQSYKSPYGYYETTIGFYSTDKIDAMPLYKAQ